MPEVATTGKDSWGLGVTLLVWFYGIFIEKLPEGVSRKAGERGVAFLPSSSLLLRIRKLAVPGRHFPGRLLTALVSASLCPTGSEQPGRPSSHGYVRSPSPSVRAQETVLQQRPSVFQGTNGTSVITPLDPSAQLRIM